MTGTDLRELAARVAHDMPVAEVRDTLPGKLLETADALDEAKAREVPEGTTCIEWLEYHGGREYDGDCLQTGAPHPRGTCDYQVHCDSRLIASGLEPSGLKAYIAARRAIAAAKAAKGGETE